MGNGGIHHKWTLAGNGDENVDTGKGSPRSLSEQLTHTRLTEIYATSGLTMYFEPKLSDFFTPHKGGGEAEKPFRAITFNRLNEP